ncbi:SRPBCC family protein [Roseateles oligotrophus]|uniref:SRPBCC family protein n=1 Tax=Roseateles oligotrophus TaxID=1769250 RepID=A0ABT2YKJ8_9BURK|nr:SRPBCC family protein [Roseateles oligotrophus]MCV2370581.1 SRPBCC family protein [Roseateles oligotrophus]
MPAPAAIVFDAFHFHQWRHRWDSLVGTTLVVGGAPCPCVGAITENTGSAWLSRLSMRTQFIAYDPPHLAAASMLGQSFPFGRWAASMRHQDQAPGHSVLIYSYNFTVGPSAIARLARPLVEWIFERQTRKRFARLALFLVSHAHEIEAWQRERTIYE